MKNLKKLSHGELLDLYDSLEERIYASDFTSEAEKNTVANERNAVAEEIQIRQGTI
jgi:hypothetical protein